MNELRCKLLDQAVVAQFMTQFQVNKDQSEFYDLGKEDPNKPSDSSVMRGSYVGRMSRRMEAARGQSIHKQQK